MVVRVLPAPETLDDTKLSGVGIGFPHIHFDERSMGKRSVARPFFIVVLIACCLCGRDVAAQSGQATPAPRTDIHVYQDRDFFGGDLAAPTVSASADACGSTCAAETRCVGFSYATKTNMCYLKGSVQTSRRADGTVAGVVISRAADFVAQDVEAAVPRSGDLNTDVTSCRIADTDVCTGCSVVCPEGTKASCHRGAEAPSAGCVQNPICACAPR
jgi:hypothetical protein